MSSINSTTEPQRPPAQPGVFADPSTAQASKGSVEAGPAGFSQQNSDTTKSLAAGGGMFSQGPIGSPVTAAAPAQPGDGTNVASGQGPSLGFPKAGDGSGMGRQPQSVQGSNVARPRQMSGGFFDSTRGGRK